MRAFLSHLIMPLPVCWLLLIISAAFIYFKKRRAGRFFLVLALGWLLIISTPIVPDLLVRSLENRYAPLLEMESPAGEYPVHIMVLGSGHTSDPRLPANGQLSLFALGRLMEGIRLHQSIPESKLVFSGWGYRDPNSQAEVMASAAALFGISPEDMYVLTEPHNTRAEAIAYEDRFGRRHRLVLVTDAIHMPRAMMHFQNAGLSPLPAPANQAVKETPVDQPVSLWPSAGPIESMQRVTHEYAGMLWAWLTR